MTDVSDGLKNVYWLGGSPCAGKTTIAELLAEQLDWRVYHCDDWYGDHKIRASPEQQPTFHRVSRLHGDALWLRPVNEQIESERAFAADEFTLALEDIRYLAAQDERPILFEGACALPGLVGPLISQSSRAFWLIPTESFQRHHYAQRPWIHNVLATTSNPERAFDNWMRRDAAFARWLEDQVRVRTLSWLSVDGSQTLSETAEFVACHFQTRTSAA